MYTGSERRSAEREPIELITNNYESLLSPAALEVAEAEKDAPHVASTDTSLRIKVIDSCGLACSFCHNEGTPVTADNRRLEPAEYVAEGRSSRVSIYLGTNGADFLSEAMEPDDALSGSVDRVKNALGIDEVHLTGGEPTLHPHISEIVQLLRAKDLGVKITSNGERFYAIAPQLEAAGLSKVVFSIFGTTPEELAAVQGAKYNNPRFAQLKLDALERSIVAANDHGIPASANIVMPDSSHAERVARVIDKFGGICKIRILNSLDEGVESYAAVYEFLAKLGAVPQQVNLTAGASGMSTDYLLPDGKEIGFKQIRHSYLEAVCGSCALRGNGCEEGFYGVRMYMDQNQEYRLGVCIQRMDLTVPIDEFLAGNLPAAIRQHRIDESQKLG
jgi:GTP 3',8-cyclase